MPRLKQELWIQCKTSTTGKIGKGTVKEEFDKYGWPNGKYRAYVICVNGQFTGDAIRYMEALRAEGWAVRWIENISTVG